eukprot:scaffold98082_cov37-Tisochrysis_lutea.AAC.3
MLLIKGGMGAIIDALVASIESNGGTVALKSRVATINLSADGKSATGVTLVSGRTLNTAEGVVCNAPIWSLPRLLGHGVKESAQASVSATLEGQADWPEKVKTFVESCTAVKMTRSYLHLHLALDATGLDLR